MAKPAVSLFFLGFCLVLVMSMSSQGVNALTCELSNYPIFDLDSCKAACVRLFADALVSSALGGGNGFPGCECCHN
ncbi:hypothetical protein MKW92_002594 [Papaver armeniacum]|nr:hypothetical protein MKW92_002594 [Papaver armeniacum]